LYYGGLEGASDRWCLPDEDALSVCDHDYVYFAKGPVVENALDLVNFRVRNEKSTRPLVDVTEILARQADNRRVDDGKRLGDMVENDPVKESFVLILQLSKEDVPVERR